MKPFLYTLASVLLMMAVPSTALAQQTSPGQTPANDAPCAGPKAAEQDPFKDVETGLTFNLGNEQEFQKFAQLLADRHNINANELDRFLDESMDQREIRDVVSRLAKQDRRKAAKEAPDIDDDGGLDELRHVDDEMNDDDDGAQPRHVKGGS